MSYPKATTLPRRSAIVQKIALDRRKLPATDDLETLDSTTEGQKKANGIGLHSTTVEIISPVRVKNIYFLFSLDF